MFSGTVKVEICEAAGLRATDKQRKFWQDEPPILDPYVLLNVDDNELDRSSTKPKTFDPVWNESFTHQVVDATTLGLTVFHDAALPPDDFVANCSIRFEHLVDRDDDAADFWVCTDFIISDKLELCTNIRLPDCWRTQRRLSSIQYLNMFQTQRNYGYEKCFQRLIRIKAESLRKAAELYPKKTVLEVHTSFAHSK